MLRFKEGDKVWYWCIGEGIRPFSLVDTIISGVDTERHEYRIEQGTCSIHFLSKNLFATKAEAIQAMYDRISHIKNEDECIHVFQKTLAKSGMYFISMCHKCGYFTGYNPE